MQELWQQGKHKRAYYSKDKVRYYEANTEKNTRYSVLLRNSQHCA